MSQRRDQLEKLFAEGARRLVARATDHYGVMPESLTPRIKTAVEKYLLKDDPETSAKTINEFIEKLQADDLCLIVACEQKNQNAWSDLVERFSPTVRSAARSVSANEENAEDLAQSIWAELHGLRARGDGKPAGKLAYYSGRGSLAGWLRAVIAQLAIDQHRKDSRMVQAEEDSDFDRITKREDQNNWSSHGGLNPEMETAQKIAGAAMQEALSQSIGQMTAEDRLLVKLYYFDGLRLREAGALMGVHEATTSRRLTRIHEQLRQAVERILLDKGWTTAETKRAFSEIAIHLDTNVESLVAGESVMVKNRNEVTG